MLDQFNTVTLFMSKYETLNVTIEMSTTFRLVLFLWP